MQLAGNLFPERIRRQQQTLARKLLEARVAGAIEKAYTKDEILELYLNNIYFGGGTRGIEAASQYYFRHPARQLTLREAALLAGLPKAPTTYDPRGDPARAKARRDLVLARMRDQGLVTPAEAASAQASGLGVARTPRKLLAAEPIAGWFLEEVRRQLEDRFGDALYQGKIRVVTTLDVVAQQAAERELGAQLARIESGAWGRFTGPRYSPTSMGDEEGTDYLQGAVVFTEAQTGDVLAWVGGRDFRHSRFDRVSEAVRQMGSAFKPFVYASAVAAGVPPTQRLSDLPLELRFADGRIWKPRNYNDSYLPEVSVREALVESRNSATVRLAETVGVDRGIELAEAAGLPSLPRSPAVVLGSAGATPLQLDRAYTAFASLGSTVEPRLLLRIEGEHGETLWNNDAEVTRKSVLDPAVAYVVTDMLQDAVRRGTGAPASAVGLPVPAAGKTGTTNERQDVWFVGYTPDVVGTVWIGFDQPRTIVPGASGGTLAAPVWGRITKALYTHRPKPGGWPAPSGVTMLMVDAQTGAIVGNGCPPPAGAAYREVFLSSAVPATSCGSGSGWWGRLRGWFGNDDGQSLPEGAPTPLETVPPDTETQPGVEGQPASEPQTAPPPESAPTSLTPFATPGGRTPPPAAAPAEPAPTIRIEPARPQLVAPPVVTPPVPSPPEPIASPRPRPRPTATPPPEAEPTEPPESQEPGIQPTEPPPRAEPTATPPQAAPRATLHRGRAPTPDVVRARSRAHDHEPTGAA
jgi:penicillin-binding protein 1A